MMRRSLIVLAATAAFIVTAPGVLADDIVPPSWRYKDPDPVVNRSTFQQWEFRTDNDGTDTPSGLIPDNYTNPPFDLLTGPLGAAVYVSVNDWISGPVEGRHGIWPLSEGDVIAIQIPNYPDGPEKKIWIQLTWMPQIQDAVPTINAMTNPMATLMVQDLVAEQSAAAGTGWIHSTYMIIVQPNPQFEMINITGDILVDEVVVDTICPEPTTMLLLGLAVPFVLKHRGRR